VEQHPVREDDGRRPESDRSKTGRIHHAWRIVRAALQMVSIIAAGTEHETLTTAAVRVVMVLGDVAVAAWQARRRH
jgi:hypothetical protein